MIEVLVTWAAAVAVATPIYFWTVRWWENPAGWAVMTMASALALVMTLVFLAVVLDVQLPDWARTLIYGVMAVALTAKLAALVYMNRRGRSQVTDKENR